ncbi:ETC complex I subunit [Jiella pacifica]|uniref:ETC complex I subunit n=1 Tax=Jiella pacifica TaxID=2696469 RepID=A0A6N9T7V6_9HYPH|nr:ETC complex I subunit [Jiella pacifica]NDW07507.1 ETC complex I subunit [Jiella pacifica]
MVARIFQPSRTAMQSGKAKTRLWVLEYEPAAPKEVEPLMGYTSSRDMRSQVRLTFDTKEQAIEYAERNGIDFRLEEQHPPKRVRVAYADNFKYDRRQPWTH